MDDPRSAREALPALNTWPDGQVRPEEPYRCGAFITGTGEQCLKLSDHDGEHAFPATVGFAVTEGDRNA